MSLAVQFNSSAADLASAFLSFMYSRCVRCPPPFSPPPPSDPNPSRPSTRISVALQALSVALQALSVARARSVTQLGLTGAGERCSGDNDFEVTAAALEPFRAFLAGGNGKVTQGKSSSKTPLKDATNSPYHVYGRDDLDLVNVVEPAALIAAATPGTLPPAMIYQHRMVTHSHTH